MREELQALATATDPLTFTQPQCAWLLAHIGDPDGAIRDELTYSLLARGFMAGGFTQAQKQWLAAQATATEGLFTGIAGAESDWVFTRTFTALLGQLMLTADVDQAFLTAAQRSQWFSWAGRYLNEERDWRALVPGHGWAHAIAHGSDLLAAAVAHPQSTAVFHQQALTTVAAVIARVQTGFTADEEERLAMVIVAVSRAQRLTPNAVPAFITATDKARWQAYEADPANNAQYFRLQAWKRVLQTLFFLVPAFAETVRPLLTGYFMRMGFVEEDGQA